MEDIGKQRVTEGEFDNLLQTFVNSRRPTDDSSKENMKKLTKQLMDACEQDSSALRWKVFVLALIHKRYHFLSPQAKAEKEATEQNVTAGDGERLIFYDAAQAIWENCRQEKSNDDPNNAAALRALIRASPLAGGTRDICTMIVEFVDAELRKILESTRENMKALDGKESLSHLVGLGLVHFQNKDDDTIKMLCQMAAAFLDEDLKIVQSNSKELPSTMHVFIPHRDRGSQRKKNKEHNANGQGRGFQGRGGRGHGGRGRGQGRGGGAAGNPASTDQKNSVSNRQLANAVAEILIWSKTTRMDDEAMSKLQSMYQNLLSASSRDDRAALKQSLHAMQTIIRKHRQQLNQFARDRGHMLRDQFALDSKEVKLSQIKRGKAGDVAALVKVAQKKQDTRILRLVNLRFSDPSKVTRFGSVSELISSWVQDPEGTSDELVVLERQIFVAKARATASYLRSVNKKKTEKPLLVASLDNSQSNHVASALVAVAFSGAVLEDSTSTEPMDTKESRLLIGGVSKDVSSFESFLTLLDEIVSGISKNQVDAPSFMTGNVATTKAVLNLIDRHLNDSEALMLFSSADVTMPSEAMKDLTKKGCSIHCHDADQIGDRLKREGAKNGDITISLAWDTKDDLDLHVHVPSGEHISYSNTVSKDQKCNLDVDMNAGSPYSTEPVENVFAGDLDKKEEAPRGKYKVVVQNFGYHGSKNGSSIPFRVIVNKNGEKGEFTGQCTGTGSNSNVTVTEFDYEGRTIPFPVSEEERAAFGTSNLVNLTSSTGQTMDSLGQLVETLFKLEHLDLARELVNEEEAGIEMDTTDVAGNEVNAEEAKNEEPSRPVVAQQGTLEVTSRDLLRIKLAKLPQTFHDLVGKEFGGGPTLAEECAKQLAKQMIADRIPIQELRRNGYPDDIIALVKTNIATVC